jgi:hypothetical protein
LFVWGNNRKELDKTDESYDLLWNVRNDSDKLSAKETQVGWCQKVEVMLFSGIYT